MNMKFLLEVVSEYPHDDLAPPIGGPHNPEPRLVLLLNQDGTSVTPVDIAAIPGLEKIPTMAMVRVIPRA